MGQSDYLCFTIEDIQLGIPLHFIDRIIRSVAVFPLPNSPKIVHGLMDFYGDIIPVINLRKRLALVEKPISQEQVFIIITTKVRKLALVADTAAGVLSLSESDLMPSRQIDTGIEAMGVYRTDEGVLLIYDPEKFLTSRDEIHLKIAIQSAQKNSMIHDSTSETF